MEQNYIRAHRLLLEAVEIQDMSDSVVKALRWRQWKVRAEQWSSTPLFLPNYPKLVQSSVRLVEQNHGAINLIASKN